MTSIVGSATDDSVNGTGADEMILGLGGEDTLKGGNGDDTVSGGAGDDKVSGNQGNDVVKGGFGDDFINGGEGSDVLVGGHGNDEFIWTANQIEDGATDVIVDFAAIDKGKGVDSLSLLDFGGATVQINAIAVGDYEGGAMNGEDLRNNATDDVILTISSYDEHGGIIATQELVMLDVWRRDSIDALEAAFAELGFEGEIGEYVPVEYGVDLLA
ncbi:hypothetical protein JANAI62_27670 [Jannaschia pagri]|uniref:Hemolysin-type calcium-binding repeat-containing protein n=1 Tax=Jannaschia pagri TaxID=2829797 RepID=A0ABQ4NP15_9RHOB|nr:MULTISPECIES: hypothetical protein [unclassified Jannaschia]GIT96144.1 hypothetical protein JANAI62_27670 [Jannaschia sp. AI_62]